MINHFRTWFINRPTEFFAESLFPVPVDADFKPAPWTEFTGAVDQALFGDEPDASLIDFRFFQFLRMIFGSRFEDHVRRFDPRETYRDDTSLLDETLFQSSVVPALGLTVTENPDRSPAFLRRIFSVLYDAKRDLPLTVFMDGDRLKPARTTPTSKNSCYVESLGLTLTATKSGSWVVDYRVKPKMPVAELVQSILDLPDSVLGPLFALVKDVAPEYEEGYRTITDTLSKCCMILFAQAVANEKRRDTVDGTRKRIAESVVDTPLDTEGPFFFGSNPNELLRMIDVKKELQKIPTVRNRRQSVEVAVPSLGYVYLCWPVRFGLPARNRIIINGFLNSAWSVYYANDLEEQYVIFRSLHKIRIDTPVRIEIP